MNINSIPRNERTGWQQGFDYIGAFSEGRAVVRIGAKWGHVDKDGRVTTPLIYDAIGSFSEGRAWVKREGEYGDVDLNGNVT